MWKRIAVVGTAATIIGGMGTAAFAASGTATPAPSPSSTSSLLDPPANTSTPEAVKKEAVKKTAVNRIRRAVHATWVTQNKETRVFTTHDAIRGLVTAVSPTSITVRSADQVTQTYLVNPGTKVFARALRTAPEAAAHRTTASISDVRTGDPVFVGGTGTTTLTAIRVVDIKR